MPRADVDHLALFDAAFLLACSKNSDYRSRVLLRARATAEVFVEHGLSSVDLAERYAQSPETFRVSLGELTDEGFEFARAHYQRWLANSDRWQGEVGIERLKQSLELQWRKFNRTAP